MTKGIFMLITGCKPAVGIIHMVCEGIITGRAPQVLLHFLPKRIELMN